MLSFTRVRNVVVTVSALALAAAVVAQNSPEPPTGTPQPPAMKPQSKLEFVQLTTSKGDIVLELNREKAPISVENFLTYVDKEFYNGTIFHRVIPNFMIQGGGFTADMQQKQTEKPIKNEWENGLKNKRGTIAMARTSIPDSATSQFFINVVDNDMLDQARDGAAYAVFGRVVAGMKAVDAIRAVPTTSKSGHQNVPEEPVIIRKAERLTAEEAKKRIDSEKAPERSPEGAKTP